MTEFRVHTEEIPERAILVGVDRGELEWPLDESLSELERLVNTAGAEVVGSITQKLEAPNPRTFIGPGKAEELAQLTKTLDADLVVFDDELSPSQQGNLEKVVGKPIKVIDRTALILDIFALHATTREGRLQVKLAQNQYLYPRLRGMWAHLASNRMGGGVGSRFGEGESQLEVDRRLIRKRIQRIKSELEQVTASRQTQRKNRQNSGVYRISLAGYTNAGKSSLMNTCTGSHVLSYDKLFATLDSTTRKMDLPNNYTATLSDTVGFIQKLPHSLVESFHSTLEEIREADLILHVVDISSKMWKAQIRSVQEVLEEIHADKIPSLLVFNKVDLASDELARVHANYPDALYVSALTGEGIPKLIERIKSEVQDSFAYMKVLIPYDKGKYVALAHEQAYIENEEYSEEGTLISLRAPSSLRSLLAEFEQVI